MKLISRSLSNWLIRKNAIEPEDRELYEYAVSCLLLSLAPLLLIICIGFFMGMVKESIFLILPFLSVRKFSGGFHLKSPFACFLCSTGLLFFLLLLVQKTDIGWLLSLILAASAVSLAILSPIDSEERKLSANEKKVFKRITIAILIIYITVYILFICFGLEHYAVCIAFGFVLPAVLQFPCLLQRKMQSFKE